MRNLFLWLLSDWETDNRVFGIDWDSCFLPTRFFLNGWDCVKWKVTGMLGSKPSKLLAEVRQTVSSILTVLSNESKQSFRPCKIFKAVWNSAVFVGKSSNFVLAKVCVRFASTENSNRNVRGNSAKWLWFW